MLIEYYDSQTDEEVAAEIEAAFDDYTVFGVSIQPQLTRFEINDPA